MDDARWGSLLRQWPPDAPDPEGLRGGTPYRLDLTAQATGSAASIHVWGILVSPSAVAFGLRVDAGVPIDYVAHYRPPRPKAATDPRFWVELPNGLLVESFGEWDGISRPPRVPREVAGWSLTDHVRHLGSDEGDLVLLRPGLEGPITMWVSWEALGIARTPLPIAVPAFC